MRDFRLSGSEEGERGRRWLGPLQSLLGYCLRKCLGGVVVLQKSVDIGDDGGDERTTGGVP